MLKINSRKYEILLIAIILIPIIISLFFVGKDDKKSALTRTVIIVEDNFRVEMDMEEFISYVLAAQMPVDSPKALLKAQSVVVRTYILKCMGNEKEITTTKLQLPYILPEKLKEIWFEQYKTKNADSLLGMAANFFNIGKSTIYEQNISKLHNIVSDTRSYVLKWQGELIMPLFHSSSNGKTRDGKENLGESFSYLKSVECYGSGEIEGNKEYVVLSVAEIEEKLAMQGIIPYMQGMEVFAQNEVTAERFLELVDIGNRDSADYVTSIKIGDTMISTNDFVNALGLQSHCFYMSAESGNIKIETRGKGHGFGMSLEYAGQLATEDKGWKDILKTFFEAEISIY